MDLEDIFPLLAGGLCAILLCVLLVFGIQSCEINVINTVPVKAYVDKKLVYEGKSGCIKVASGGRTTTVTVLGGFLCFYPQKEYVSEDVHIEGIK